MVMSYSVGKIKKRRDRELLENVEAVLNDMFGKASWEEDNWVKM